MTKSIVAFSIADANNMPYFEMMKASFQKFHPDIPLILIDQAAIDRFRDPHFFYRATPIVAKNLLRDYDEILKLDADTIITGNLDHIFEGDFDVATVYNSNPREDKTYPVRFLDVDPMQYVCAGFVVMKSKAFVDHWLGLCRSKHFLNYQYREQDLLNFMVHYMSEEVGGPYKVKFLDQGDSFYNLASKGYWPNIEVKDNQLVLPPVTDELGTYPETEKIIRAIHWAGGNSPDKMKYKLRFKKEVCDYIDKLVK